MGTDRLAGGWSLKKELPKSRSLTCGSSSRSGSAEARGQTWYLGTPGARGDPSDEVIGHSSGSPTYCRTSDSVRRWILVSEKAMFAVWRFGGVSID